MITLTQLSRWLVTRRIGLFALCLLAVAVLCGGALKSSFDTSLSALLTRSDPYLEEVRAMDAEFPSPEQITFAFVPEEGSVFQPEVLAALAELRRNYLRIPHALRLSTLLEYQSPEAPLALFEQPWQEYDQERLRSIREEALGDRLLTATLLAPGGGMTFALVTLEPQVLTDDQRLEVADAVQQLRRELQERYPRVAVHINSDVLYEDASRDAMVSDLSFLLPAIILICVLAVCLCFRSLRFGGCILAQALATVAATVGLIGWLGLAFNSISIIAPLVVVIIAVADSVHVISLYRQQLIRGLSPREAMAGSLRYNFRAITLTTVTTGIGFASLMLSSSPAIDDFGLIVAIGIVLAWLTTLALLPALIVWFCSSRALPAGESRIIAGLVKGSLHLLRTREQLLFRSFSVLAVATALLLPLNETDFNRLDFVPAGSELRSYYDAVEEHFNRGPALTYGIDTGDIDGAIRPDFLRRVDAFSQWLLRQPDIESAASVVDVVKTIHRFQNELRPEFFVIPDDIDTVADHLNDYALVQQPDVPLDVFIDRDFATIPLFINAVPMSNQQLIDLDRRITAAIEDYLPEAQLLHGSSLLLFARMDELVTLELLRGYALSLVLISLTLVVGLRSLRYGLLSALPNVLPATVVFGLWGLFVGQLDPFVMMLFSISIGLVVDDTVHILSHYSEHRRATEYRAPVQDSVNEAITRAGPALIITTGVLALGTIMLVAAESLYFQQAAKLLVPIVVLALVLDLLYLPPILTRLERAFSPGNAG